MSTQRCKVRVAHLVSHPIQYYVPLYRALAQRPEIDLTVYFFSIASLSQHLELDFGRSVTWDVPLTGGYRYELVGDASNRKLRGKPDFRPNWGILRDLVRKRYDVIWLHGYANGNAWLVGFLARLLGTPVLLRDDQTLLTPRSPRNRFIKRLILPVLFRKVSGLCVGRSNQDYFKCYGTKRIFPVVHAVDNDYFRQCCRNLMPTRREIREQFGILDNRPVILFCGKFVDRKKPLLLLEAYMNAKRRLDCHLLLVGDGPLRSQIQRQILENNIRDVHFAGFLNQSEISSAYVAADMLVLPSASQETWGLVVNEAMNFSLPIIVSDRVGCAADLVEQGRNGFVFPSGDVGRLSAALQQLVECGKLRSAFGKRSLEIIESYSVDVVCDQVINACLSAAEKPALLSGHHGHSEPLENDIP